MNNNTQEHSSLGLAAFILSLVAVLGSAIFILAAIKIMTVGLTYGAMLLIGIVIITTILLSLNGLVFSFVALFQKNRKKLYSILGLIINACVFLAIVILLILGHLSAL